MLLNSTSRDEKIMVSTIQRQLKEHNRHRGVLMKSVWSIE